MAEGEVTSPTNLPCFPLCAPHKGVGRDFAGNGAGQGAFNLSFGGLKNLATNTWAEAVYSNSGWRLISYGTL